VLGTDGLNEFMDKYNITLSSRYDNILGTYERKPWFLFIDEDNRHLATDDALDLMDKLLRYTMLHSQDKMFLSGFHNFRS
jgi:casein kinase II subunit alpha